LLYHLNFDVAFEPAFAHNFDRARKSLVTLILFETQSPIGQQLSALLAETIEDI